MRQVKCIVLHCSDSSDSLDIGRKEINDWHKERGFLSPSGIHIGYHYVIRRTGKIEEGRPESEVGAHVAGYNSKSIGICWVGRNTMDSRQLVSALQLVKSLMTKYNIPLDQVYGHCELDDKKTCPNISMPHFRGELLFAKQEGT